jgi:serine/threonine-protein kinase
VTASSVVAVALGLLVGVRLPRSGTSSAQPVSLSLSFPTDAAPFTDQTNPLALSPDGRTLVYVGARNDRQQLFLRPFDRDEIRPIPGTDGAEFPFFSPDGLWVGFFAETKLKKVSLAGGLPIVLCDAPDTRRANWGADGTIVFVPSPSGGIWRIPASGGEPKLVLAANVEKGERPGSPSVLPDGENVLFATIQRLFRMRADVVSLRTGKQRTILENARDPRYLPTGHLAFTRAGVLYAAPFSLQRLETTGPPVPLLDDVVTNRYWMETAEFAWSEQGTLVYVPYRPPRRTLAWVDRKGAVEPLPFPPGGYEEIALSPDGERLAAISTGEAEERSLFFGDIPRGTLTRSTAEGIFTTPAWTPDGRRVAFSFSPDGMSPMGVFWQDADGSAPPERLTDEARSQLMRPTSFSPDGRVLLVQLYSVAQTGPAGARFEPLVLSLTGERTLRPLLQTKYSVENAKFSPDGRWVAFSSDESGRFEIYVQSYPPPGPRWQISTDGGKEPCWSRSERELFFRSGDRMMLVDVETKPTFRAGRPRTLFKESFFATKWSTYGVAPDGSRFLMIKPDPAESGPAHVNVVLNWFEEVKRRVPGAK